MQLEIIALCDAATEQGGRLNLLGVFDQLNVNLPFVLPHSAIALRFRIKDAVQNVRQLSLKFTDPQGNDFIPVLNTELTLPEDGPAGGRALNMVLNLQGLKFKHEGIYHLRVKIDDNLMAENILRVMDNTPKEPNPLDFN